MRNFTRAAMLSFAVFVAPVDANPSASNDVFEVSQQQLVRLGVRLATAEAVSAIEIATVPAQVVVPNAQQVLVSAPVAGLVARILAAEGETIGEGDILAEIESSDFLDWQREYLDAVAENELAMAQSARDRALYADGIIAERRMDETDARAQATSRRLDQAEQQLRIANQSEADLKNLAGGAQLSTRLTLRAPLGGVVLKQYAQVGSRVDSLDPLQLVADLDALWLELHLSQESVNQIEPGMLAVVNVAGEALTSTITTIGRIVDAATQTVLVRATVENTSSLLTAGQFLSAKIIAPIESGTAFAVPATAVTRDAGVTYVFTRHPQGFVAQPVEILSEDGNRVFVRAGIDQSAEIAIEGISTLKSLWLSSQENDG